MKHGFTACLVIVLCAIHLTVARPWTPDDDAILGIPVEGAVEINSQVLGIGHLKIRISDPVVKMVQLELNKRNWTLVTVDGETRLWQDGKPALPLISRAIRLPNTGNVNLIVTLGEFTEYHGIDVLPQQPTDLKKEGDNLVPIHYSYDESVYSSDEWYPKEIAGITAPEILRDARVALLGVSPVQYNPVTRTLRVYKSIELETVPVGGVSVNELTSTISHTVPSFAAIYDDIIGAGDLSFDSRNAPPGKILFICRAGVQTQLQSFVDWKTQTGRISQIVTTTATIADSIKNQIILPAYNSLVDAPLETVMLVGDGGSTTANFELPAYRDGTSYNQYTDHKYSTIGSSMIASYWVGRIHCDNSTELQTQMNRSMNYERIPFMGTTGSDTAWYHTGWGYTTLTMNVVSNYSAIHFCLEMMRVRGLSNLLYDEYASHVDPSTVNARLNPGALFWANRGSWIYQFTQSDYAGINNVNKPFITLNITCSTGDWYGPTATGIQVALTKLGTPTAPRGAIAGISTETSTSNPPHNNCITCGTYYALGTKNVRQPGPMYFEGKYQLWRNFRYGDSTQTAGFVCWNNPMGDLTTNFWTGVPRIITSDAPNSIAIGQNHLVVQVRQGTTPVVGAIVTAWKKNAGGTNETYTRVISDDSGRVVLMLTNTSSGNMLLTITGNQPGQNLYPIVDTVQVIQSPTDLAYSNQTILDDSFAGRVGNNNGVANPGETVDVTLQLINRGTNSATGISGLLTSGDSRITLINGAAAWNTDSAGATVGSNTPFRIQLGTGFHDNETVPLTLNLTTNQGNRTLTIPVVIRTIHLVFISDTTTPSVIVPGGTATVSITVRNNGGLANGSTNAELFSNSVYVMVDNPNATFTSLPLGTNVSNPANQLFTVSTNGRIVPGMIVTLGAAFSSGAVRDTVYFDITVGTKTTHDPTGPDPYGYLAYDNTDTAYSVIAPTYNWIEIIPALGGSGVRLPINDRTIAANSASSDTSMVIRLPFTVRYYGANYDSATICGNGWFAFGAQPYFNNLRNWHLPAQEGPRNIVAVNWCEQTNTGTNEGAFVKYDSVAHVFIVTWKTTTLYSASAQEVQLVIYDQAHYLTPTNDAMLKFQYKTFHPAQYSGGETGVSYATVGIADSNRMRGLEYCFWNVYTPGSAPIPTGTPTSGNRAILFTTSLRTTGNLTGTVRRASDNQIVRGVNISVINGGRATITDSLGHYTMNYLQIGFYRVQASGLGYNTIIDTVTILDSITSTLNFVLTSPGLRVSVHDTTVRPNDSISINLFDQRQSTQNIYLHNTGNGLLSWNSALTVSTGSDELDSLWDQVFSFNVSQVCSDNVINGVEFDGNNFWVSGGNNYNLPHHLYKVDRTGHLIRTYACPDSFSYFGWRDLAWDGRRYLYGSFSQFIDKIDTANGAVITRYRTNVSPARALAVDTSNGVLYYADQASPIYKMRLSDGVTIGSIPNPTTGGLYGLGWYPLDSENKYLYAFIRDSLAHTHGTRIYRIDPVTGAYTSAVTLGLPGENAGGLAITPKWNPLLWTAVSVLQGASGTRIALFELNFYTGWITYSPHTDTLSPGRWDTVSVHLDARSLPNGYYHAALQFNNNSSTSSYTVPIILYYDDHGIHVSETNTSQPDNYSLKQNFPNPFNPTTEIRFALKYRGLTTVTVFDVTGRKVDELVNEQLEAGVHTIRFDGSKLATGIYFYRIESGKFTDVKKMVLLK